MVNTGAKLGRALAFSGNRHPSLRDPWRSDRADDRANSQQENGRELERHHRPQPVHTEHRRKG